MTKTQLNDILRTLNEKDRDATEALARGNRLYDVGEDDAVQDALRDHAEARGARNAIIDVLAVLGYVAGIDRKTREWIIIRKQ